MTLRRRIRAAWWVLRHGPGTITWEPEPNVEYDTPPMLVSGPIGMCIGSGTMTGDLTTVSGPPPIMHVDGYEVPMADGPFVLRADQ